MSSESFVDQDSLAVSQLMQRIESGFRYHTDIRIDDRGSKPMIEASLPTDLRPLEELQ
jgi:hypothetical protein